MAPFDSSAGSGGTPHDVFSSSIRSLTLEFSRAADYPRIDHLFDPAVKQDYDPHNYVLKRREEDFQQTVANGGACLLSAGDGEVAAMAVAYHSHEDENPAPGTPHDYTEFGTTLSRVPGYNSAQLIVAALALHEWWQSPPARAMAAFIDDGNAASIHTYRDTMKWEEITDPALIAALTVACSRNLAPGEDGPKEGHTVDSLYTFTRSSLAAHARILLAFMDQGGLLNRRTGDFIPVDFHALEDEGLTRGRLEAMAQGVTSRPALLQMT